LRGAEGDEAIQSEIAVKCRILFGVLSHALDCFASLAMTA
jgi:hypothetical protein